MPVVPIAEGVTFPLPLEPDIEHIRQLQAPPPLQHHHLQSAGPSPVASSSLHFSADRNCSGFHRDELSVSGTAFVENCTDWFQDPALTGPWWIQLFLGHDFVYYAFPVMLTVGLVCDLLGAAVMAAVICRSRSSKAETVAKGYHVNGGVATSGNGSSRQISLSGRATHRGGNVYLMWNMASGAILLTCGWTHRLADYYPTDPTTGDSSLWPTADEVTRRLSGGYIRAVDEWLSYANLWLLVTMDLDKALRLTSSGAAGVDDNSQSSSSSASTSSKSASSAYRKEAIICCSVYAVCLVSSLPHFFAFHTVETFDVTKNRTIVVSQPSNELTDSFEYRVVYYWYVVTLTVFIPLPLLIIISAVMVRALVTRRRQRLRSKHKRQQQHSLHNHSNGHCSGIVSKSIISRKQSYTISSGSCSSSVGGNTSDSSAAIDASSALSARLLLVTTALCLLFTSPRTLITCFEGLPSSRWWPAVTGRDTSEPTPASDGVDVVVDVQSQSSTSSSSAAVAGELIRSLAEFSFYLYHASPFPLVCSYHDQLYRMLLRLFRYVCCRCCCCCTERCQRRRSTKHSRHASNYRGTGQSRPTAHGIKKAVKKSVKFDSRTIEIEIQC